MNFPPIATASSGRLIWTCPVCKTKKTDANIHLDFDRGVVHCGCAHRPAG